MKAKGIQDPQRKTRAAARRAVTKERKRIIAYLEARQIDLRVRGASPFNAGWNAAMQSIAQSLGEETT